MSRLAVGALLRQFGPTTGATTPATPTLAVNAAGTLATISGSTAGTTNTVEIGAAVVGSPYTYTFTSGGSRTGDGTVTLSLSAGHYWAYVNSSNSGGAAVSNFVYFVVASTAVDAIEVQIADAVVSELYDPARSWSGAFTPVRSWLPIFRKDNLEALRVTVIPVLIPEEKKIDRAKEEMVYEVDIDLAQVVQFSDGEVDDETVDELTKLAQDVHDFFRDGHRLATMPTVQIKMATRPELYNLDRLHEQHTWESMIQLEARIWR